MNAAVTRLPVRCGQTKVLARARNTGVSNSHLIDQPVCVIGRQFVDWHHVIGANPLICANLAKWVVKTALIKWDLERTGNRLSFVPF